MCELSAILAAYEGSGYVVAPAGYGKTHLIAEATGRSTGRQLILTHTYAGVNALRTKMRALGVSDRLYRIDTIASWSLRLSLSYSQTSGWEQDRPADNEQWNALYEACARLLDQEFIRKIIRASYDGLYVDEYQDCSVAQHRIVLKLARDLPCRILGDPLQSIFDFEGQDAVDWARHVEENFENLGVLETPHRWINAGSDDLAVWLRNVRRRLEQGQAIDLNANRPASVRLIQTGAEPQALMRSQGNSCRYIQCEQDHTVIAIHKGSQEYKAKCHILSRNLGGRYSSIEEVEGKSLFSFIRRIERARTVSEQLQEVIAFAKKCMTGVDANLPAGSLRGERVAIRANTRSPDVAQKANSYLNEPTSAAMAEFLLSLKGLAGIEVIRADLFNRTMAVLRKHILLPELSFSEAAEKYHQEFRHTGRPVGKRRQIGTTLLVKGLEFDHAIVLDATSLRKKELYVALTRGARSLTIVSTNTVLNPED
ncbi:UvrD-helicase domain-containing protein [Roseibium aggregatum]|uniref:UvrD-helicase domain-containing protein n=1 Tax=Roseibium aggregatum TaxID=187304 RepID=UPI001E4FB9F3|nr:UvrD-helicase domain-containing protein [Roseibium aggregatum]